MTRRNSPHKWLLIIQPEAQEAFDNLSPANKRSVFRHLRELLNADEPYNSSLVEMLKDKKFERVRKFRVGDFRVLFILEAVEVIDQKHAYKGTFFLLDIRDRKEAY